jgi:hypothetical protein
LTVKVCPATVSVPERGPPVVDEARNCTLPVPDPLAPDVIVSHASLLVAVHAQPLPVVTSTLPVPPEEARLVLVADRENAQPVP